MSKSKRGKRKPTGQYRKGIIQRVRRTMNNSTVESLEHLIQETNRKKSDDAQQ